MAEFPSLPLWTDAVLGDTRNLNTEQFGAYMLMLIVAWRAPDNTLPADDKQLASITGLSKSKWLRSKDLLIKFWTEEDGRLRQKKLDKVKNSVRENAQKNKANADARWLKNKETGNATAVPNGCQTDALHNQNHKEDIHREETPLFEKFWEVFPRQRRGAKDKALSAYKNALKRATEEQIYEGTIRYIASDEVARGYGKGAAAWLNDDRWTFDYKTPTAAGGKPAGSKPTNYERALLAGIGGCAD